MEGKRNTKEKKGKIEGKVTENRKKSQRIKENRETWDIELYRIQNI